MAAVTVLYASVAGAQSDSRQAAMALEKQGRNAEAETAWHIVAAQHPGDAEPLAHLGLLEARQEHYAEAIRNYRKALALAPSMPGLQLNLGLAYFKKGDYREAIATFAPSLKANPDDERLTLLTGMSHYGLGEYTEATPFLKKAADRDDKNLTLQLTLAHSCLFSKQYHCVLDAYHRIVALDAQSAEAAMLAGEALDEMHEPVAAIREFEAAERANPKEPNVHFGLGYLLWKKGQYPEAATEFQAELVNEPQHTQAMRYLANCYLKTNRLDDARALLEKVIAQEPANAMEHRDLGFVYAEDQQNQDAIRELQKAESLAPKDVSVHYRLGRLYRTLGKNAEAKAELDKAASLNKETDEGLLKVMSTAPKNRENQALPDVK